MATARTASAEVVCRVNHLAGGGRGGEVVSLASGTALHVGDQTVKVPKAFGSQDTNGQICPPIVNAIIESAVEGFSSLVLVLGADVGQTLFHDNSAAGLIDVFAERLMRKIASIGGSQAWKVGMSAYSIDGDEQQDLLHPDGSHVRPIGSALTVSEIVAVEDARQIIARLQGVQDAELSSVFFRFVVFDVVIGRGAMVHFLSADVHRALHTYRPIRDVLDWLSEQTHTLAEVEEYEKAHVRGGVGKHLLKLMKNSQLYLIATLDPYDPKPAMARQFLATASDMTRNASTCTRTYAQSILDFTRTKGAGAVSQHSSILWGRSSTAREPGATSIRPQHGDEPLLRRNLDQSLRTVNEDVKSSQAVAQAGDSSLPQDHDGGSNPRAHRDQLGSSSDGPHIYETPPALRAVTRSKGVTPPPSIHDELGEAAAESGADDNAVSHRDATADRHDPAATAGTYTSASRSNLDGLDLDTLRHLFTLGDEISADLRQQLREKATTRISSTTPNSSMDTTASDACCNSCRQSETSVVQRAEAGRLAELEHLVKELKQTMRQVDITNIKLQQENDVTKAENERLKLELSALRTEFEDKLDVRQQLLQENEELEERLRRSNDKVSSFTTELERASEVISSIQERLSGYQQEVDNLSADLTSEREENESLRRRNEELESLYNELRKFDEEKLQKIKGLNTDKHELHDTIEQLQRANKTLQKQVDEATREQERAQHQLETIQASTSGTQEKLAQYESENRQLFERAIRAESDMKALETENARLEQEAREADESVRAMQQHTQDLRDKVDALVGKVEKFKKERSSLRTRVAELYSILAAINSTFLEAQSLANKCQNQRYFAGKAKNLAESVKSVFDQLVQLTATVEAKDRTRYDVLQKLKGQQEASFL